MFDEEDGLQFRPTVVRLSAMPQNIRPWACFVAFATGGLVACGKPATKEQCEAIFARSAEISLRERGVTEPKAMAERVAEVRAAQGEALMAQCVGKRVTDGQMQCIRSAQTKAALEGCLK